VCPIEAESWGASEALDTARRMMTAAEVAEEGRLKRRRAQAADPPVPLVPEEGEQDPGGAAAPLEAGIQGDGGGAGPSSSAAAAAGEAPGRLLAGQATRSARIAAAIHRVRAPPRRGRGGLRYLTLYPPPGAFITDRSSPDCRCSTPEPPSPSA
jgi:hypothetical protein